MITEIDAITMRRNYDTKLSASKLSGDFIKGNYELVYNVAENVGNIGILAYPKIYQIILFIIYISYVIMSKLE